jgi:hypothetical protein
MEFLQNTHQWFGKHVVTVFDDHDQVGCETQVSFLWRNPSVMNCVGWPGRVCLPIVSMDVTRDLDKLFGRGW